MKILLLGGTGAMGVPLAKILSNAGNEVHVTSRSERQSGKNLYYIKGNGHNIDFLKNLLQKNYDAIVDFMVYHPDELSNNLNTLLQNTDQYVFFSSSRVYANSKTFLTENSKRLLDVCEDVEYLKTDEYALAKAREEDLLRKSNRKNWTIIRPYITYNSQRLQLGVYEKENWLKRALEGRTVVFPKTIAERITSFTYGYDVAYITAQLIGNDKAYGQTFHIANPEQITWMEVFNCYQKIIEAKTGKKIKIKLVDNADGLTKVWNPYQIKYDRLYDRRFDNSKIQSIIGTNLKYKSVENGLETCLSEFFEHPMWLDINANYEAWCDKQTHEVTPLNEINGVKNRLIYIKNRLL